jgi:hypothetical protein
MIVRVWQFPSNEYASYKMLLWKKGVVGVEH